MSGERREQALVRINSDAGLPDLEESAPKGVT
jgi:hypothetical protein